VRRKRSGVMDVLVEDGVSVDGRAVLCPVCKGKGYIPKGEAEGK